MSEHKPPKIVTSHVWPPIPIRSMDWVAHYDDPEGPTGEGATEAEAIRDLVENHPRENEVNDCAALGITPPGVDTDR